MIGNILWTLLYIITFPGFAIVAWVWFDKERSRASYREPRASRIVKLKFAGCLAALLTMFVVAILSVWTDLDWVDLFI